MQTPRPPGTPGRPPLGNTGTSSNAADERVDYDTLTDVMGYAGVDLKVRNELPNVGQSVPSFAK
jgi:hypothetical protein